MSGELESWAWLVHQSVLATTRSNSRRLMRRDREKTLEPQGFQLRLNGRTYNRHQRLELIAE